MSKLADYAEAVHAAGSIDRPSRLFPMFVMALDAFLKMTRIQRHEELLEKGFLYPFEASIGRAMFVSHQWLSPTNPDPTFEQLEVLQQTMKGLLRGTSKVSLPPCDELIWGRVKCPTASDFKSTFIFLWFDYFCIPQGQARAADRQLAIDSIPSYVAECYYFIILCPALKHQNGHTVSFQTWSERGWCRMERMARDLLRNDGILIQVQVASRPIIVPANTGGVGSASRAPGKGEFTVESDRGRIGRLVNRLLFHKLQFFLSIGDFHNYRFLFNMQQLCLEGLGVGRIEALVPGFLPEIDPSTDPEAFVVARFLHENGFEKVEDRDKAGWSPMCYAVLRNDPFLVKALVKSKANVNDRLSKTQKDALLPKKLPILLLAVAYHCNAAMSALLSARANVNISGALGENAMTSAACVNNHEAVRVLVEAKIDPTAKVFPGTSVFKCGCIYGSLLAMQEMRKYFPVNLRFSLHIGLAFFVDGPTISYLISAAADVNEQLDIPITRKGTWWSVLKALSLRHHVSPSALTYLAYHHRGATPLMFSIMTGKFEAASILLSHGARLDLRNSRGKTAEEILVEMRTPISLDTLVSPRSSPLKFLGSEEDDTVDSLIQEAF